MPVDFFEDPHERALERVRFIAHQYQAEPFVISGIDEDAEMENREVVAEEKVSGNGK